MEVLLRSGFAVAEIGADRREYRFGGDAGTPLFARINGLWVNPDTVLSETATES
ncbi:hypothetical protein [Nocardia cyriacigeorgica]|uniref:hypothetical protein n=1 Tax=Nocardia cyriacigeorgica TaxID=135487 RepID=UPI002453CE64|nr:hypothetical protein [Nocardia cyriacigeorgica]